MQATPFVRANMLSKPSDRQNQQTKTHTLTDILEEDQLSKHMPYGHTPP